MVLTAEDLFPDQMLGMYLYGSATLGCLRPDSDLDILLIVDREMSAAIRKELTRCEYMYGEWLREEIDAGRIPQPCEDPDMAIQHRIKEGRMIPSIPFAEVQKAIRDSLPGLTEDIRGDERNILLTLARMWFTMKTENLTTKDIAADWVIPRLPDDLAPLMESARDGYMGKSIDKWDSVQGRTELLVEYLKAKILEHTKQCGGEEQVQNSERI